MNRGWGAYGRAWRRVDPLAPLTGLVALVVYYLHGFGGVLGRDLAVYSYGAQQVVDGVPPYLGILTRTGPLAQLIPAVGVAGARVIGIDDVLGIRLLMLVVAAASVCVIYLLGRDLFGSPFAGLAAAAALLSFHGFIELASNGPREKTSMVLFLLCCLLATTRQRWFWAGLFVGLATLVWQFAFLVSFTAVLVGLLFAAAPHRLRALGQVLLGGLVPLGACLVYYALNGALAQFFEAFVLINVRYSRTTPFTSNIADRWQDLQHGYGITLWVMLAGLAALLVLASTAIISRGWRRNALDAALVGAGAGTVAALSVSLRTYNNWPDAFILLPLAALGIGGLTRSIGQRLSPRGAMALAMGWVVFSVVVALSYSLGARDHTLRIERASVDTVLERLPPDSSILSIEAPQALVLSGKTNPTRYQMFPDSLTTYVDGVWPGGIEGYGRWIGRREPTVIAFGAGEVPTWLHGTLQSEYHRVSRAPGWSWWVHKSVGRPVTSSIRTAVRALPNR